MENEQLAKDNFRQLLDNFDLLSYLQDNGIEYSTGGNNVSDGWIGLRCIFCGDHSNHLGVSLDGHSINCWICGTTGTFVKYIMEYEGVPFPVAKHILGEYQNLFTKRPETRLERRRYDQILPEEMLPIEEGKEPPLVKAYMERRRFPLSICQKYKLGWCRSGLYKLRLIVPVYLDGALVSFQAADMTGEAKIKYLDCPKDRAIVFNKHTLYGIDDVTGDTVRIVEGVTDKWRLGDTAVASSTKNFTIAQANLLAEKARGKAVEVIFDSDAAGKAVEVARMLRTRSTFKSVHVVTLPVGDPADLTATEVVELFLSA